MELSERKLRWRFFWRRTGVAAGTVGVVVAAYVLVLGSIVGGWLPLPFRLAQALMFVVPPLLLTPFTLLLVVVAVACPRSVRRAIDAALPCGGRRWNPIRMRGRQNSTDEICDNICVSLQAACVAVVILPLLHACWYPVPGSPKSPAVFSALFLVCAGLLAYMLHTMFLYMDTKQGLIHAAEQADLRADDRDEPAVPATDTSNMPEAARSALLRHRRTFKESPDGVAANTNREASVQPAAPRSMQPVFSTLRVAALSSAAYWCMSACLLGVFWYLGGEVRKCMELISEVSFEDIKQIIEFVLAGGDRYVISRKG